MIVLLNLVDRDGDEAVAWLDSSSSAPALTDEFGHPLIDMDTHRFYPQPFDLPQPSTPPVKAFLDAFMMRPSPGLDMSWFGADADQAHPDWMQRFADFADAIGTLTGKRLVGLSVVG